MKFNDYTFQTEFDQMKEFAKSGEVLTIEDKERVYEFRAVRDLTPIEREERHSAWLARLEKGKGTVLRYDYEEGPIIPLEEWGNLA